METQRQGKKKKVKNVENKKLKKKRENVRLDQENQKLIKKKPNPMNL